MARSSFSKYSTSNWPWRNIIWRTSNRVGFTRLFSPLIALTKSANSQGRPKHPRPTTTPAQPVCSIIDVASFPDQISPLPSTGTPVGARCSTNSVILFQSDLPSYNCAAVLAWSATQVTPKSAADFADSKKV